MNLQNEFSLFFVPSKRNTSESRLSGGVASGCCGPDRPEHADMFTEDRALSRLYLHHIAGIVHDGQVIKSRSHKAKGTVALDRAVE